MPNPKKTSVRKRSREIKLALTETEYQQVVDQASSAGYPPSVFARLVVLGTHSKAATAINPQAWSEVGIHLSRLQQILAVLYQIQHDTIDSPTGAIALPQLLPIVFEQELEKLRQSCLALIRRSAIDLEES